MRRTDWDQELARLDAVFALHAFHERQRADLRIAQLQDWIRLCRLHHGLAYRIGSYEEELEALLAL